MMNTIVSESQAHLQYKNCLLTDAQLTTSKTKSEKKSI